MIQIKNLCVGYPGWPVLKHATLELTPGKVVAILGPNGSGKSTMLKAIAGILPKTSGDILLDAQPLERFSPREIAKKVAYLPQSRVVPNISARRMVLHGRFPYLAYPRHYGKRDWDMVETALSRVGAEDLAERALPTLSGGQRQKIYLAMALAQDTQTILMDEPTTYLDMNCQLEVMALVSRLAKEEKTMILVLHDLCMALQHADQIILLQDGKVMYCGTPEELYQNHSIEDVMKVRIGRISTALGWRYFYL